MVDIRKASRIREKEVRSDLDRMEMVEALRHGNVYEVFAKSKNFKISDFNDFFATQWKSWKGNVVQEMDIKAPPASMHEPVINHFPVHNKAAVMSKEEGEAFSSAMQDFGSDIGSKFKGSKFKASKFKAADKDVTTMTEEELADAAANIKDDWQNFQDSTWSQILDAQMMSDYKSKMEDVQNEIRKIIDLVKRGVLGPEFALIALAKVNATKNGVLMSWMGRKASHVNDSLSRIANDLHAKTPGADASYQADVQLASSKSRDGAYQLNLLTSDMQKVMQDVAGVMDQVKSMMDEINRTRREIITKVSAH